MSNVYFLGCVYTNAPGGDIGTESMDPNGDDDYDKPRFGFTHWKHCTTSKPGSGVWVVPITLAMLPLLIRFVQSVKRWVDSKLVTHLINVRRYVAVICLGYLKAMSTRVGSTVQGLSIMQCTMPGGTMVECILFGP